MGSYQRFPKFSPAAEAARQRDQEWRENEWRRAMRLTEPAEKIEPSRAALLGGPRFDATVPERAASRPTLH